MSRKRNADAMAAAEPLEERAPTTPTSHTFYQRISGLVSSVVNYFMPSSTAPPTLSATVHTAGINGNKRRIVQEDDQHVQNPKSMPGAWPHTPPKTTRKTLYTFTSSLVLPTPKARRFSPTRSHRIVGSPLFGNAIKSSAFEERALKRSVQEYMELPQSLDEVDAYPTPSNSEITASPPREEAATPPQPEAVASPHGQVRLQQAAVAYKLAEKFSGDHFMSGALVPNKLQQPRRSNCNITRPPRLVKERSKPKRNVLSTLSDGSERINKSTPFKSSVLSKSEHITKSTPQYTATPPLSSSARTNTSALLKAINPLFASPEHLNKSTPPHKASPLVSSSQRLLKSSLLKNVTPALRSSERATNSPKLRKEGFSADFSDSDDSSYFSSSPDKVSTPIKTLNKRTTKATPYRRPAGSILRSTLLDHLRLEPSPSKPSPLPFNFRKKTEQLGHFEQIDDEGDVGMFDRPEVSPERPTKIRWPKPSAFAPDLFNPNKVPRWFHKYLAINELPEIDEYWENWEQTREQKPIINLDETTILESPLRLDYGQEQEKSPEKVEGEKSHDDTDIAELFVKWNNKTQFEEVEQEDMSSSVRQRWEDAKEERLREEMRVRHEKEAVIREEIMKKQEEADVKVAEQMRQRVLKLQMERMSEKLAKDAADAKEAEEAQDRRRTENAEKLQRQAEEEEELRKRSQIIPDSLLLNQEAREAIRARLRGIPPHVMMIEKDSVSRHDMGTLLPVDASDNSSGWLNDSIVNTMLKHIITHANATENHNMAQREKPAPYFAFNSAWFAAVEAKRSGSAISRWGGKRGFNLNGEKIRNAKVVLFPVCTSSHWTVAVLNLNTCTIEVMNSMANPAFEKRIYNAVLLWLKHELPESYVQAEWKQVGNMSKQQENICDCGVFTVLNSLARVKDTPSYLLRNYVDQNVVGGAGREWIAEILFKGGFGGEWAFRVERPLAWDGGVDMHPNWAGWVFDW